jgi:hypothetical protein
MRLHSSVLARGRLHLRTPRLLKPAQRRGHDDGRHLANIHTPAHSDACIAGLKESGRRAVYTYSRSWVASDGEDLLSADQHVIGFEDADPGSKLTTTPPLSKMRWLGSRSTCVSDPMSRFPGGCNIIPHSKIIGAAVRYRDLLSPRQRLLRS